MSILIHELEGKRKKTMARYQTAIAIGGYLGPRAKELLHFTWFDFVEKTEKDLFEFKTEKDRKVYFNKKLLRLIRSNYAIVDPDNVHEYIMQGPGQPGRPISTVAFNKTFKKLLERFEIETDNPSSHTLRKTFAARVFRKQGADENALIFVSEILNHSSIQYTRKYIGIRKRQIRTVYLTMD